MNRKGVVFLFLWLVPAVFAWVLFAFLSVVNWCGISGCGTSGFGQTTDFRFLAFGFWLAGGIVMVLPFLLVPWSQRFKVRLAVGLVAGVAAAGLMAVFVAS